MSEKKQWFFKVKEKDIIPNKLSAGAVEEKKKLSFTMTIFPHCNRTCLIACVPKFERKNKDSQCIKTKTQNETKTKSLHQVDHKVTGIKL